MEMEIEMETGSSRRLIELNLLLLVISWLIIATYLCMSDAIAKKLKRPNGGRAVYQNYIYKLQVKGYILPSGLKVGVAYNRSGWGIVKRASLKGWNPQKATKQGTNDTTVPLRTPISIYLLTCFQPGLMLVTWNDSMLIRL